MQALLVDDRQHPDGGVGWVPAFRQIAGGTDPVEKAVPGSLRGDYGTEVQYNLVHGSDSPESAAREIKLWFPTL